MAPDSADPKDVFQGPRLRVWEAGPSVNTTPGCLPQLRISQPFHESIKT